MIAHGIDGEAYLRSRSAYDRVIYLGLLHWAVRTRHDQHQDLANRTANAMQ